MSNRDEQRRITRTALQAATDTGFALAGSGAIREHGLTNRPTEDIDLFTVQAMAEGFDCDGLRHRLPAT